MEWNEKPEEKFEQSRGNATWGNQVVYFNTVKSGT